MDGDRCSQDECCVCADVLQQTPENISAFMGSGRLCNSRRTWCPEASSPAAVAIFTITGHVKCLTSSEGME